MASRIVAVSSIIPFSRIPAGNKVSQDKPVRSYALSRPHRRLFALEEVFLTLRETTRFPFGADYCPANDKIYLVGSIIDVIVEADRRGRSLTFTALGEGPRSMNKKLKTLKVWLTSTNARALKVVISKTCIALQNKYAKQIDAINQERQDLESKAKTTLSQAAVYVSGEFSSMNLSECRASVRQLEQFLGF